MLEATRSYAFTIVLGGWREKVIFINVAYQLVDGNLAKLQQRVAMTMTIGVLEFGRIVGDELITAWAERYQVEHCWLPKGFS